MPMTMTCTIRPLTNGEVEQLFHDVTVGDIRRAVESGDLPTRLGRGGTRFIARADLRTWLDTWATDRRGVGHTVNS